MFSVFIGSICSVIVVICRCLCTCLLDQWKHLSDIPFPKLGKRSKIDVLIGSDHCCNCTSEGHGASNTAYLNTSGYLNNYRIQQSECSDGDLNYPLKQFWSLEAVGVTPEMEEPLFPKENLVAFDNVMVIEI